MKKIFFLFTFISLFIFVFQVNAQMMGRPTASPSEQSSTQQDEAAGKAVWDKLQNKQVTCKDLKDDDFDVLGDFFMGNMMGSNHASMNQMMAQRLGDNGEKQMHIAMGKRLSGCDTSVSFPQGAGYFMPMMGMMNGWNNQSWGTNGNSMIGNFYGNMMNNSWGLFGIAIWIIVIIFLIFGIIYFWKGINK